MAKAKVIDLQRPNPLNKHSVMEDGNIANSHTNPEAPAPVKGKKTSAIAQVRECVKTFTGEFTAQEVAEKLPQVARQEISRCLGRLVDEGLLIKVKHGVFRLLGSDDIRILRVRPIPVPLKMPLGLERHVKVFRGELIAVAGAQNACKSAWLMALAWRNRLLFPEGVKYFSSEWGDAQLTLRVNEFIDHFGMTPEDWEARVSFKECPRDFKVQVDALEVDRLNIIDYLAVTQDPYKVADRFDEILQRMKGNPGLAAVAIQMKHGRKTGRGDSYSLERPTLYVSFDYYPEVRLRRLEIIKAKVPANPAVDPNGLAFWFTLKGGCRFIRHAPPEDADKIVANAAKAAAGR